MKCYFTLVGALFVSLIAPVFFPSQWLLADIALVSVILGIVFTLVEGYVIQGKAMGPVSALLTVAYSSLLYGMVAFVFCLSLQVIWWKSALVSLVGMVVFVVVQLMTDHILQQEGR